MKTQSIPSMSPECEAILHAADQSAEAGSSTMAGLVTIRDDEGSPRFDVSAGIAPIDLRAIIHRGRRERAAGERAGRGELQRQLRQLIGAAGTPIAD
ncbi:hypothetical protein OOT46_28085 [Aquabacterium sp. A7-Y]|uniref:hypothetical protein n=1 Tax=Aquabacterium sp. A7-Y TaxID=1349605 RepID=UPI00223CE246|nr:hypothetical protein [Aquabacterium sp. A7-Y]MCW7541662.1 hypothetical protein [Aquabacterium sp. A7-Y]